MMVSTTVSQCIGARTKLAIQSDSGSSLTNYEEQHVLSACYRTMRPLPSANNTVGDLFGDND